MCRLSGFEEELGGRLLISAGVCKQFHYGPVPIHVIDLCREYGMYFETCKHQDNSNFL
jgi:hypothetical protein